MRIRKCGLKLHGHSEWVEDTASKRYQETFKRWKTHERVSIAKKTPEP